jgi:glycerol kinase
LAGLATGVWKDVGELESLWEEARRFTPAGDPERLKPMRRGWRGAVKRSLHWAREMAMEEDV